ncbi:ATP-binding domain-containing protein [Aquabacterium sp. A7-Y]|uniref:3'-5' exonuclease n=1 Tax=Aquabacterium sp. A7-Y TaxID=1349605 RepID=UPI00223E7BDA|nr:3'-5' exonuclease [Aquabacterium sp. A7-Y]MCW7538252.1 ATP-binding domain-containing protein [Aquabacterium sp. A7-Y]
MVLGSIEAAKGLEFDHVLLPWLERHRFPDPHEPAGDEANLFYVAITRARERLTLLAREDAPSALLAAMQ